MELYLVEEKPMPVEIQTTIIHLLALQKESIFRLMVRIMTNFILKVLFLEVEMHLVRKDIVISTFQIMEHLKTIKKIFPSKELILSH